MKLNIFACAYWPSMFLLQWNLFKSLAQFLIWLFVFLLLNLSFCMFTYFTYKSFISYVNWKYFLPMCVSLEQMFLILIKSNLSIFSHFLGHIFVIKTKKLWFHSFFSIIFLFFFGFHFDPYSSLRQELKSLIWDFSSFLIRHFSAIKF